MGIAAKKNPESWVYTVKITQKMINQLDIMFHVPFPDSRILKILKLKYRKYFRRVFPAYLDVIDPK